ncbi:hypothetical protein, partial [Ligilactobacillus acidipiscis]|uniref:hypothetical protein n=1 Tax=Ligilactobacillus acidipiscis TaxID=89059 RepID=UPI0002492BF5
SFLRAFCVLKSASFFAKFGAKEQPIFARKGELRGGRKPTSYKLVQNNKSSAFVFKCVCLH